MDPDIVGYTVYCSNLDTGMTKEVNVTEAGFIFTGLSNKADNPSLCHAYQFRVSAWNAVGEGEKSDAIQTSFGGEG